MKQKQKKEIINNKEMFVSEPTLLNRYVQTFFFPRQIYFLLQNSLNSDSDELIIKSKWRPPAEYW